MADRLSRIVIPPGTKLRIGVTRTAGELTGAELFGIDPREPDEWHEVMLGGNGFKWEENLWFIIYGQRAIRLPHAKGLGYIRYLLERPDQRVPVSELVEAVQAGEREANCTTDAGRMKAATSEASLIQTTLGDAGPASDHQALAELNDRVNELNAEISEAESNNNSAESERLNLEKDRILKRITADFDIHGRPRAERSTLNRHRNAVRKCIKDAIEEIRARHPDLAAHLERSIKYGYGCRYRPQENPGWLFDW